MSDIFRVLTLVDFKEDFLLKFEIATIQIIHANFNTMRRQIYF